MNLSVVKPAGRWRVACALWVTICGLSIGRGAESRVTVLAGIAHETFSFEPLGGSHRNSTPRFYERPFRYVVETRDATGQDPPPAWIVKWVDGFLGSQGYVAGSDSAPYLLVFEWGPVDPQISHIGRPLQTVEASARWIIEPREVTRSYRERLGDYRERMKTTAPICTISVYAQKFTGEPPTVDDLKWQMKLWLLLYRVPASGRVFAGPETVLDYSFPEPKPGAERNK